ncbi:MAG: hypothetical protein JWM80_2833 [Cyanobacteria bacterium RYN_339]|nr:hypothetical protein [Cyanobacteria bacterium RYN_339]
MDKVRALLLELTQDDYVRFKYGKAVEAALKALDAQQAVDLRDIEAKLTALLEVVRQPTVKSKPPRPQAGKAPRPT